MAERQGGVTEEVIDPQELEVTAGVDVLRLGGEYGVSECFMIPVEKLCQEEAVIEMSGSIETESTGGEGGDDAFAFRLQERLGERIEQGELEVSVETVHGEKKRLL